MGDFNECKHNWEFHIDSAKSGSPNSKPWQSFFHCKGCSNTITFTEKFILDQTLQQKDSLAIQERHTKIGMWANIISVGLLLLTLITLLFGSGIVK